MSVVSVQASRCYDIEIGQGLLPLLGDRVAGLGRGKSVCLVSETTVYPLYGAEAEKSLRDAGFTVSSFVFEAGESSKCADTYIALLNFLARQRITRSDWLVALGGGVVGDLAGFAAATYLRGIRFVQVPTTLLAAVDSSVGGKTAIDLDAGKNLAGAFCQPSYVLCDTDTLHTLPEDIFRDGCAEVIKYAVLYDEKTFDELTRDGAAFDRESIIVRCVGWKRDVVARDEFDTGERRMLNLGHTVGHAVEARSHYTLSHGKSVAIGLAIVSRACAKTGFCLPETAQRIVDCLGRFGLPTETDASAEELTEFALSDKKRQGGTVALILPEKIGRCRIVPTKVEALTDFIRAGL